MKVNKESCHRMVYFLSKSNQIFNSHRPELNGIFDLIFPNDDNDVTTQLLTNKISAGETVNLNEKLNDLRIRFPGNTASYLYVWCPFLERNNSSVSSDDDNNVDVKKYEFEFIFKINEDTIEIENKNYHRDYLNYQMRNINIGKSNIEETVKESDNVYEKVKAKILSSKNGAVLVAVSYTHLTLPTTPYV